jgi:hypothetical protein
MGKRAERQAERAAAVSAASGSVDAGRAAGRRAVVGLHETLAAMRAEVAGDPVAAAAATTVLLHALVGDGPRGQADDSLAAAGRADRAAAVGALLDSGLLDVPGVAALLDVDPKVVRDILAGPRPRRRKQPAPAPTPAAPAAGSVPAEPIPGQVTITEAIAAA